ncbi:hypothetical protein J6Q66_04225 [bacterium]|nr:hypothetical protein [bacterium]
MKINKVNASPSFKAKLSSEIQLEFYTIARKTLPTSYAGKKLLKNIEFIYNSMPHISLSIEKLNKQNKNLYGFVLNNPKTGKIKEIEPFLENSKDLFNARHIDNIKWALLDEKNAESNVKINQKPYMDIFS